MIKKVYDDGVCARHTICSAFLKSNRKLTDGHHLKMLRVSFQAFLFFCLAAVRLAQPACIAITNIRYCRWNQVYTYYPEVQMADWVSVDSSALCGSCPAGKYYDIECGAPKKERWDGCGACWPGTYSLGGDRPVCIPCAAGGYAPDFQMTGCRPCPIGTYSAEIGMSACLRCPPGTFYNFTGADNPSRCVGPAVRSYVETAAPQSGINEVWS